MAAYLGAGVGILKTLEQLRKQFAATALGPVLNRVTLSIRQGDSLTEALGREKKVFDPLFLSMIRAAEARGGVPETLRMLATQYEARLRLLRQARSALIYPVIVVVIALAVVFFLTLVVLPILLKGLEGRANDLPGPTQALMAFTSFVQASGWWLVPLVVVGVPVLLWRWYRTRSGKRWLDEIAMRLPVLGKLLHLIDTTRFARTLASLLDAGVDIGSSLDLTADVLHLSPLQSAVRRTKWAVEEGSEISLALADTRKFSPELIAVLESGEETGKITETLEKLADDTEERVEYMVKNLGSLIQPLIVIFLGGIVLFIALAFVMAYVNLLQSASRM
jgi:type II secretory pathway component PulF